MKPWYDLDFPVTKFILDDVTVQYYDDFPPNEDGSHRPWGVRYFPQELILTQEFIDFLCSIGVRDGKELHYTDYNEKMLSLFRGEPNNQLFIHQDSPSTKYNSWGINLSWGCEESEMRWYKIKENIDPKILNVLTGRKVDVYTEDQVDLVAAHKITKLRPTLIRGDIPHHAVNYGKTLRWSVSIRDQKKWTWEDAVEYFKPWISDDQFL